MGVSYFIKPKMSLGKNYNRSHTSIYRVQMHPFVINGEHPCLRNFQEIRGTENSGSDLAISHGCSLAFFVYLFASPRHEKCKEKDRGRNEETIKPKKREMHELPNSEIVKNLGPLVSPLS